MILGTSSGCANFIDHRHKRRRLALENGDRAMFIRHENPNLAIILRKKHRLHIIYHLLDMRDGFLLEPAPVSVCDFNNPSFSEKLTALGAAHDESDTMPQLRVRIVSRKNAGALKVEPEYKIN